MWGKLPLNYFIAFGSYSLILLLEKVAFDSHSLTEGHHYHHDHNDMEKLEPFLKKGLSNSHDEYDELENKEVHHYDENHKHNESGFKILKCLKKKDKPCSYDDKMRMRGNTYNAKNVSFSPPNNGDEHINIVVTEPVEADNDIDIDEDTIKNIVSTKGKFASYLQNRNICNSF
jgi:hypothetical protein